MRAAHAFSRELGNNSVGLAAVAAGTL